MSTFNIVSADNESTVVTEYISNNKRATDYQSEAALENEFIKQLISQGYEHIDIKNESALISNLRRQLESLNNYSFSDREWDRFFKENISNATGGGVRLVAGGFFNMHNGIISGNEAATTGGGIAHAGTTGILRIQNGIIYGNTETQPALRNTATTNGAALSIIAAISGVGVAQSGTFNNATPPVFTSVGNLLTTGTAIAHENNTITVEDGVVITD